MGVASPIQSPFLPLSGLNPPSCGSDHDRSVVEFQDLQVPTRIPDVGAILLPLLNVPHGFLAGKMTIPVYPEAIEQDDWLPVECLVTTRLQGWLGGFFRHGLPNCMTRANQLAPLSTRNAQSERD